MTFLISYGLVFVASFFNSIMDATENSPNFHESRLKNMPKQFWLKEVSWKYAAKFMGYKFDAWHLAKSAMIICFVLAIIFHEHKNAWFVEVALFGAIWNFGFWLNYHKILGVK